LIAIEGADDGCLFCCQDLNKPQLFALTLLQQSQHAISNKIFASLSFKEELSVPQWMPSTDMGRTTVLANQHNTIRYSKVNARNSFKNCANDLGCPTISAYNVPYDIPDSTCDSAIDENGEYCYVTNRTVSVYSDRTTT
jgi:hypothetical protein